MSLIRQFKTAQVSVGTTGVIGQYVEFAGFCAVVWFTLSKQAGELSSGFLRGVIKSREAVAFEHPVLQV